jgi:hypothetical protein
MKATLLSYSLENKVGKSPSAAILETASKVSELKSILQSQSNLTDDEQVILVDNFGHKVADFSKTLSVNMQGQSFFTYMASKMHWQESLVLLSKWLMVIIIIKVIVSYHPVKILSNTWVILFLQQWQIRWW